MVLSNISAGGIRMKRFISLIFCFIIMILCFPNSASANISPLKIKSDGVEPILNPGLKIESADISVSPSSNGFKFDCKYILKGIQDIDNLTIGVPGDLGYTLEAGYIDDINITVNQKPVKYKPYNTSKLLSDIWKNYNSPLNFKWHTFPVSVKKNATLEIVLAYNISWRIFEQNKSYPYSIVPFLLSTDKFFDGEPGSYNIKFINDDILSIPDVKVMVNSIPQPDIISQTILSPVWNTSEILWKFNSTKDFQDFRLIALSFRKLTMDFSIGSDIDSKIKWAMLNNNFDKLASIFEDIATHKIDAKLDKQSLGTAAYLAAEFYFRLNNYDKALEMLSLPNKSALWSTSIKYDYIYSVKLNKENNYKLLLEQLKKLSQHKDYILLSSYAEKLIPPVNDNILKQAEEKKIADEIKDREIKNQEIEKQNKEKQIVENQNTKKQQDIENFYHATTLISTVISTVSSIFMILLYFIYKNLRRR